MPEPETAPIPPSTDLQRRDPSTEPAEAGRDLRDAAVTATTATPSAIPVRAQLGIGGVAVAAAVLSFSSLRELAISTGTWSWIAFLLPISLDAAAGVSMFVWMRAPAAHVIRYARRLTWASILVSIICNGANHGFAASIVTPPWYAAVAVGAIPPIMFGAVIHLAFLSRQPAQWGGPEAVTAVAEIDRSVAPAETYADFSTATAIEMPRRAITPRVTTPLRRPPKPVELHAVPSVERDDEPPSRPGERRCGNPGCDKLLPSKSRADRKFCNSNCRQAAARVASRDRGATA